MPLTISAFSSSQSRRHQRATLVWSAKQHTRSRVRARRSARKALGAPVEPVSVRHLCDHGRHAMHRVGACSRHLIPSSPFFLFFLICKNLFCLFRCPSLVLFPIPFFHFTNTVNPSVNSYLAARTGPWGGMLHRALSSRPGLSGPQLSYLCSKDDSSDLQMC